MPRTVQFEGKMYYFPDDVTDQEIQASLPAASQSDVRKEDNYFVDREATISKLGKDRRLNTRDKNLARQVYMSPEKTAADEAFDKTPANLAELVGEIKAQKNPKSEKILQDEHDRLTFGSILGIK